MKFGLVCATMCQGLTMSAGDIYDTEKEADDELDDMREQMRIARAEDGDQEEPGDDDYMVIEIFKTPEGGYADEAGSIITVISEETPT